MKLFFEKTTVECHSIKGAIFFVFSETTVLELLFYMVLNVGQ